MIPFPQNFGGSSQPNRELEESGLPIFSQTGGAQIGLSESATWPFVRFSATSDMIRLSIAQDYVFRRSDIQCLSGHGGIFSGGLRIEHTISGYPRFIVFGTLDYKALKSALEGLGYEVRDAPMSDNWWDGGQFLAGVVSFVPTVGVLFGFFFVMRGLSSHTKSGKALGAMGAAGIAFNVLLSVFF